ncbi:MAG TPA: hypothetical protein PKD63_03235 [Solirubrobacteraceae bacterium]|nr:hypothetical protein [Solirubrobacteraceae bacterium]
MGPALALTGCAALAAGALVVRSDRARAWLLLGALVVAPAILLVHVADSDQVRTLRDRPSLAVAAALLGLGLVAALAVVFRRAPTAFAVAAVATIPFRIPISVAGSTSNLLLPLYLVVAAGALAWAVPRLREESHRVDLADPSRQGAVPEPGWLERLLAISLVIYAAQSAYAGDEGRALENVVFFYVPFAVLYVLLARLEWTRRLAGIALGVLTGLAVALASIGYVEFATRHLLLNPKVIASNQLEDYFRVNSLFFDPNIYGRFLVVVLVLLVAWMLWRARPRDVALGALVTAFLFGGLVLTLSQSSFAALLVGLAVLGALRWSVRWALAGGRGRRGRARRDRARDDGVRRRRQLQQGDERALGPHRRRRAAVRRAPGPGLGGGGVLPRVSPRGGRVRRARDLRVAHDPGDGRRRAGDRRPRRVPGPAGLRVPAPVPRCRA